MKRKVKIIALKFEFPGTSERSLHCIYKFENAQKNGLQNDEDNEEQHKFHSKHLKLIS